MCNVREWVGCFSEIKGGFKIIGGYDQSPIQTDGRGGVICVCGEGGGGEREEGIREGENGRKG